jgi:hypothetical protein
MIEIIVYISIKITKNYQYNKKRSLNMKYIQKL